MLICGHRCTDNVFDALRLHHATVSFAGGSTVAWSSASRSSAASAHAVALLALLLQCQTTSSWSLSHSQTSHALPLLSLLRQVTATNVDIARVAPTYHLLSVAEVEEVIARL